MGTWILKNIKDLEEISTDAFSASCIYEEFSIDLSGLNKLEFKADGEFFGNPTLTSVNITGCSSINQVPKSLFAFCENLVKIVGWDEIKSNITTIEDGAFGGCKKLYLSLIGMNKLKTIKQMAFQCCEDLPLDMTLNNFPILESVGPLAFDDIYTVFKVDLHGSIYAKDFRLPFNSVKMPTPSAYIDMSNCPNLEIFGEVGGGKDHSLTTWAESLKLDNCPNLTTILDCCYKNEMLKTASIKNCPKLNNLREAFMEASNVTSIDLTGCVGLTIISLNAFNTCLKLERVGWLDGTTHSAEFGHDKFPLLEGFDTNSLKDCRSLTDLFCEGLIGTYPFGAGCFQTASFKHIYAKNCKQAVCLGTASTGRPDYTGSFLSNSSLESIDVSGWDNCIKIASACFRACTKLHQIGTTPNVFDFDECFTNLQFIENCAFTGVKNASKVKGVSQSIKSIGITSFAEISNLKEVDLRCDDNVTFGTMCFAKCNKLTKFRLTGAGVSCICDDRAFYGWRRTATGYNDVPVANLDVYFDFDNNNYTIIQNAPSYGKEPVDSTIFPSIFAGIKDNNSIVTIHLRNTTSSGDSVETNLKNTAKTLEDASSDIKWLITSNGTASTTTGGTSGTVTASTYKWWDVNECPEYTWPWGQGCNFTGNIVPAPGSLVIPDNVAPAIVYDL